MNRFYVDNGRLIYGPNGKDVGAVYKEVDGYYVFVPEGDGAWEGVWLIAVGELLNEMNAAWDAELRAALSDTLPLFELDA